MLSLSGQADMFNYSLELSYTSEYSTAQENKETASFTSNSLTRFFLLTVFVCLFFILALAALQYGNNPFCNTQECNKREFGGGNNLDLTV